MNRLSFGLEGVEWRWRFSEFGNMKLEGYHVQLFFVLLGAFGNGICMTVGFM